MVKSNSQNMWQLDLHTGTSCFRLSNKRRSVTAVHKSDFHTVRLKRPPIITAIDKKQQALHNYRSLCEVAAVGQTTPEFQNWICQKMRGGKKRRRRGDLEERRFVGIVWKIGSY